MTRKAHNVSVDHSTDVQQIATSKAKLLRFRALVYESGTVDTAEFCRKKLRCSYEHARLVILGKRKSGALKMRIVQELGQEAAALFEEVA